MRKFILRYETQMTKTYKIRFAIRDTNLGIQKLILRYENIKQYTYLFQNSKQCQLYEETFFLNIEQTQICADASNKCSSNKENVDFAI